MSYLIGIDGGGTKTTFAIASLDKGIISKSDFPSCYLEQCGIENFIKIMEDGLSYLLRETGLEKSDISGVCAGLPSFGEDKKNDEIMLKEMNRIFSFAKLACVNDVEVGWAGSLAMKTGISIVSGTGSIYFGKSEDGKTMRSGGWGEFLGDEGSAYWLGKITLSLFGKQSDGRIEKGPLYELFKKEFDLKDDFDIMPYTYSTLINSRNKVAAIQKILFEAAKEGDKSAINAYKNAADEIALGVISIIKGLEMNGMVNVSYSGGVFNVGKFLLDPLKLALKNYNIILTKPLHTPSEGSILLSANICNFDIDKLSKVFSQK